MTSKRRRLARQYRPEINVGTADIPEWVEIGGITEMSPSRNRSNTDTTAFDSEGADEHLVTSRGKELTMSGQERYNDTDARDPGQQALLDADTEIGEDAEIDFRVVYRPTNIIKAHFPATVEVGSPFGGGVNDASTFNATITRTGNDANDVGETAA